MVKQQQQRQKPEFWIKMVTYWSPCLGKIQTHERFKRMIFVRKKCNMQIFGIILFIKLQNNNKTIKWWKMRHRTRTLICFWLTYVVFVCLCRQNLLCPLLSLRVRGYENCENWGPVYCTHTHACTHTHTHTPTPPSPRPHPLYTCLHTHTHLHGLLHTACMYYM